MNKKPQSQQEERNSKDQSKEINKKEVKETIANINKIKMQFFGKINKIGQLLTILMKKKGRYKLLKSEMKLTPLKYKGS